MIVEIAQAVEFLCRLLAVKVDPDTLDSFKQNLTNILHVRFDGHWDAQRPYAGNGYRAISNFNGVLDPVLVETAKLSNLLPNMIYSCLPRDFVLWIDPYTVSYRVGDHGNVLTLFEDRSRGRITFRLDANSPAVTSIHEIVGLRSPTSPPLLPQISLSQVSQQQSQQPEVPLFQFLVNRTPVKISPPPSPEGKKGGGQLIMAN